MAIDVPLLRKELEFVTYNRQHWRQATFLASEEACGTVGCLAGNGLLHAGQVIAFTNLETRNVEFAPLFDWWDDGAKLFGITENQADGLFRGGNTLRDLWEIACAITGGAIEVPPDVDGPTSLTGQMWADYLRVGGVAE